MTLLLEWMTPPSTHMYMIEGWYRMPKGLAYPLIEIEQKDQALDPDAQVYYFFVVGVKLPGDHQVPAMAWRTGGAWRRYPMLFGASSFGSGDGGGARVPEDGPACTPFVKKMTGFSWFLTNLDSGYHLRIIKVRIMIIRHVR